MRHFKSRALKAPWRMVSILTGWKLRLLQVWSYEIELMRVLWGNIHSDSCWLKKFIMEDLKKHCHSYLEAPCFVFKLNACRSLTNSVQTARQTIITMTFKLTLSIPVACLQVPMNLKGLLKGNQSIYVNLLTKEHLCELSDVKVPLLFFLFDFL